ncbi:MAG: branched-chain amino acid ABC transporter permease [Proteobacteria bacterium]|nr:branched-chain amino acid ABC transporter permease [Pseudomonadota bacterium]
MAALLPPLLDILSIVLILVLVALGLVVVFGLMGVINMAHGEFFLLGAYGVFVLAGAGVPFVLAVPVTAAAVGLFGLVVEGLLIRHLLHRTLDTILATWGLSIVLKQAVTLVFGPASVSVALPFDANLTVGAFSYPGYRLVVMAVAVAVIAAVAWVYGRSGFGLSVRASIERPDMAAALGIDVRRVTRFGFAGGAALAALAGALVAPMVSVDPQMGLGYLVPAFLAILVGGAGLLSGVLGGSALVGGLDGALTLAVSPVVAQVIVFALAVIVIRLRPRGLFGGRD